jgi:hypothetical protein
MKKAWGWALTNDALTVPQSIIYKKNLCFEIILSTNLILDKRH